MLDLQPLLRIDELLARFQWPVLNPVDSVSLSRGDVLVMCAGFEDRATFALNSAVKSGSEDFSAVVIEYLPRYDENRAEEIRKIFSEVGVTVEWLTYNRRLPAGIGEIVTDRIVGAGNIYIDVSAMSRMLIVQLVVALAGRTCGLSRVRILYTEACEYPPSRQQFAEDRESGQVDIAIVDSYISSGVWDLAAVPELSAPAAQAEAVRLIVFPSFNPAQLRLLLQELQPTFVDLINGVPPRGENAWRLDAIQLCNAGAVRGLRSVADHEASTLDYRETLRLSLNLYDRRGAFDKLVIAPTGSKMQSVAIGIVRAFLSDIQIVYPTPQEFLEPGGHTLGASQIYSLDLDGFENVEW